MYPEELIKVVAHVLGDYSWEDWTDEAAEVLDALGFAPYGGPKYWRSAIHVEAQ